MPPDVHQESAWQRAWRDFPERRQRLRPTVFVAGVGIVAACVAVYLSWDHGRTATVVITALSAAAGALVASGLVLGALWSVTPALQRDEARDEREVLLRQLDDKAQNEELDAAIAERLPIGVELKEFAEHMPIGAYESQFMPRFEAWDTENVELLERLAPRFVADYKFAEVPVELYESEPWGAGTKRILRPEGQVEAKLRSLRAIREQLRAER